MEEADPPLSGPSPTLLPPLPRKPVHVSLMFLTRVPSTTSLSVHHLTPSTPCYSGPVRAPAFMERQTGAPRTGFKSSLWPPSVSRSTDRVTQDNGIDPKPFWRLRAILKEPNLIKPRSGRPWRGAPASATISQRIGLRSRAKNGDCHQFARRLSPAWLGGSFAETCGRWLKRIGWLEGVKKSGTVTSGVLEVA